MLVNILAFSHCRACRCTKPPVTIPGVPPKVGHLVPPIETWPSFQDCWNGNKCILDEHCGKNGQCIGVAIQTSLPPEIG